MIYALAAIIFLVQPSSALALVLGILFALMAPRHMQQPVQWIPMVLGISITGLGAGMDLHSVIDAGRQGVVYTLCGISLTMLIGLGLGKLLRVPSETALLISAGTAICGGSAIAAVAAAVRPRPEATSMALLIVFALNAVALVALPPIAHQLGLTEDQFGLWAALAIHDTSSVVGASMAYGPRALIVATTIKLTRALWIVPLVMTICILKHRHTDGAKRRILPWFIVGFLLTASLVTFYPVLQPAGVIVSSAAKRLFLVALFWIGATFKAEKFKGVGLRPMLQGVLLWILVLGGTLLWIL